MRGSKLRPLDDSDRAFVDGLYEEFKNLIYAVARKYFGGNQADVDDAFSGTAERMCRYVEKLRAIESNNLKNYVISMTVNVCRQMLIERKRKSGLDTLEEYAQNVADSIDIYTAAFEYDDAKALLDSMDKLDEREKLLLYLRHVEQLEFAEIAEQLDTTKGAVRTALTRVRQSVLQDADQKKEDLQ